MHKHRRYSNIYTLYTGHAVHLFGSKSPSQGVSPEEILDLTFMCDFDISNGSLTEEKISMALSVRRYLEDNTYSRMPKC